MKKHSTILTVLISTLFLFSCTNEDKNISTYYVINKSFQNSITVDGITEPLESVNIVCPRSGSRGTVAFLVEDGTFVEEGDVVCIIKNTELETWYDQQKTNFENQKGNLEKTRAELRMQYALLEAQVNTNEAETKIAHLDSLQLQFYSPNQRRIRELELKKTAIEKAKHSKKKNALELIQQSEIKKIELEIQRTTIHVNSTKENLETLTLKAPKKGLATIGINPMTGEKFKVGDITWMNMTLVSIPGMEKMKMKIMATETEYRYINVDDSVSYNFDAMPNNIAWGKIINKMPIGKEIKQGSRVKMFEIESSIDSVIKIPDPGFTATCHIILKQVRDTITVPQIAIFEQDSMKIVYVEHKDGYEIRQIETAESSPKEAVVSKGLHLYETITLKKPRESAINSKTILADSIK